MIITTLILWITSCFAVFLLVQYGRKDRVIKMIATAMLLLLIIVMALIIGYNTGQKDASIGIHPGSAHKSYWFNKQIIQVPEGLVYRPEIKPWED